MRRFLIWSGLAVVIGLVLAVSGYLAYDYFYARFQPVTIARNQGEIQRLLDEASWVSPGGGDRPLYIIGYRDSAATQTYQRQEAGMLRAAGVDVRVLMFARPDRDGAAQSTPNERATIAELWLNRDWDLYRRWTSEPASAWVAEGLAPADGNLARTAVVDASRQFVARLDGLMRSVGVKPTWPLIIWRDRQGFLKACACADARSWAFIRDDLGAPDAAGQVGAPQALPATGDGVGAVAPDLDAHGLDAPHLDAPAPAYEGLPYPDPPIAPPVRSATPQAPEARPLPLKPTQAPPAARPPAPANSRLERPAPPRPSNRPQVQPEDTQFY